MWAIALVGLLVLLSIKADDGPGPAGPVPMPPIPEGEGAPPPIPPLVNTPTPGIDANGGPLVNAGPTICQQTKSDGEFSICLYMSGGKWGFRATDAGGAAKAAGAGLATKSDALVEAWRVLLAFPTLVVGAPRIRHGVRITPSGYLELVDAVAWSEWATPIYQGFIDAGVKGADALVVATLGALFPAVNVFRLSPAGETIGKVGQRVFPVRDDAAAAVAMFFVPADPLVQIDVGPGDELVQHAGGDGRTWWIVTTSGSALNKSGTELVPTATWRVWGPDSPLVGDPVASGATALRATAVANAKAWIGAQ